MQEELWGLWMTVKNVRWTMDAQWSVFSSKFQTFGLWQINLGAFEGIFNQFISIYFGLWGPCPCFPLINHYFYKKLIPTIYLGLGFEFEFGPQRIRNLAIMCPYSVECAFTEIRYNHFVLSHQNCIHVLRSRRNVLNSWCNQSQCKPARTHSISGLKSRVLKLTFLP